MMMDLVLYRIVAESFYGVVAVYIVVHAVVHAAVGAAVDAAAGAAVDAAADVAVDVAADVAVDAAVDAVDAVAAANVPNVYGHCISCPAQDWWIREELG